MPRPVIAWAILLLYGGLLFLPGLTHRDLTSSHEARAAQNAQMIVDEGCWGLPRLFDRHIELQKPPLFYWLVALLGHMRGGDVDAWAVRLPSALSALGCVLFLYLVGTRSGRPRAGFLAALILASFVHFTWLARVGRIDMPLTLAVTLAGGGFYVGMFAGAARSGWPWYALAYVGVALGIMLKGPIALVLAVAIVGAFVLCEVPWARAERPMLAGLRNSLVWGMPLMLVIALPWFVWANAETDNRLWEVFFRHHNFERGLGGSDSLSAHPVWFYVPRTMIDLLPWSLLLAPAAWYFLRRVGWRQDREARFGALWFLAVLGVLSCVSFKRADYLLPAYPGAALFLGAIGDRCQLCRRVSVVLAALLVSYGLGWGAYIACFESSASYRELGREIRARTHMPVIFFRTEAHALAYHVGRPLDTILEWENLDVWASHPVPVYFVMTPDCARDWPRHLFKGRLEEVFRTTERDRTLVVMRSVPNDV